MQTKIVRFKDQLTEEARKKQCDEILEKYSDKVPIICEMHNRSKLTPLDKNK